jgi:hypothetical protein
MREAKRQMIARLDAEPENYPQEVSVNPATWGATSRLD